MAVGKMTTSLEIHKWSLKNNIKSTSHHNNNTQDNSQSQSQPTQASVPMEE